jgi:hypothetical protein
VEENQWIFKTHEWYKVLIVLLPLTLLIWILGVVVYIIIFSRILDPSSNVIAGIVVFIHGCILISTILWDTEDVNVKNAKRDRNIDYVKLTGVPVIDPETLYCNICQVNVNPETKHCKSCNKCVAHYDHHCTFLSTCIGKNNYYAFLVLITLGSLISLYLAGLAAFLFVQYFVDKSYFYLYSMIG